MGKISEALERGKIEGNPSYEKCGSEPILVKTKEVIEVGKWKEDHLELDDKGYFLFEVEEGWIYAGFVEEGNVMTKVFKGKRAIDVFKFILKEELISSKDHAAYIGYELGKCEECLKEGKEYVQS
jgi:hypothetical protein